MTAAVFVVVFSSFTGKGFFLKLAIGVAIFEFCVNMLYMVSRMDHHATAPELSVAMKVFAAVHGSLSLLVFVAFVVLTFLAYGEAKRGLHFFRAHKVVTWTFVTLWTASVVSGEVLYFLKP